MTSMIPSADVCDDVSAMEDDVVQYSYVAVLCVVAGELSPLFFFPFFAPKFVEAHSLKKLPPTQRGTYLVRATAKLFIYTKLIRLDIYDYIIWLSSSNKLATFQT